MDVINDGTGTYKFGNYKICYFDNSFTGDPYKTEIKKYNRSKGFLPLITKAFNKILKMRD
jgi:hypothetical protein